MRTYETTHPWLSFSLNLSHAPARLWLMLGECQSKCEHIAHTPLRPDTAKRLSLIYLAKGTAATTSIEGNTLTEEQVLRHLEGKLTLPPSQQYLQKEIDNIVAVCNESLDMIMAGRLPALAKQRILMVNQSVLRDLSLPEYVLPGMIRTFPVGVGSYRGAPEADCDYLLDRLCEWLNGDDFKAQPGLEISSAILKAILAHLYIAWIHPFGDGNGRTARLLEFEILIFSGVPAPAAHLLSNHYNQTRSEYYRQLDRAGATREALSFVTYAVEGFFDGLKSQLDSIREQQWDVTWRNYVHELFSREHGRTMERRRHLALDLSRRETATPFSEISNLSPRLAKAYASKTQKTISRDLRDLMDRDLIEKSAEGYRAKRERILTFLPPRAHRS